MKYLKFMLPALALLASAPSFADFVFINGGKYIINEFATSTDTRRIAEFEIDGDDGQEITFDITAKVAGLGRIKPDIICEYNAGSTVCYTGDDPNINDFVYAVRMTATCVADDGSTVAIGQDTDDENIYTSQPIHDFRKEVTLTIDNTLVTGGKCDNMNIDIRGNLDVIEYVDLEVLIYEQF
ncbi:hypothetical protein SG34_000250 [Thalassomonas viridans]|uniref:Uncharacterized protein n=1 Tax=Thalassomonas viridans TaxID=137584 RepID=A0AAE9Z3K2_9GAMM|nr:hypothetical protein [Thalassomonas viridans]WDE05419.1 hypothetical protein SG34_000250 [Thalassomonas viridans]